MRRSWEAWPWSSNILGIEEEEEEEMCQQSMVVITMVWWYWAMCPTLYH